MRTVGAILAGTWLAGGTALAQDSAPDLFRARPDTYAPRYDPRQQQPAAPYPIVPYGILIDDSAPGRGVQSTGAGREPTASRGYLSLFVQPVTAQIYVDGFFVGTIEDYGGTPGPLIDAGPHRVELRADGYETAEFDVRIEPGVVVTLREDLVKAGTSPAAAPPPAAPARARARTFYVIPRCYAGDTPPRTAHLPAGCSLADLRTVPAAGDPAPPAAPDRLAR